MFEPNAAGACRPTCALVSGWSARCSVADRPDHLHSDLDGPTNGPSATLNATRTARSTRWTDLTYLLHAHHVSLGRTTSHAARQPDCDDGDDDAACTRPQDAEHAGDLEPAAALRHGPRRRPARQRPAARAASSRAAQRGHAAGGLVGRRRTTRRSEHPPALGRGGPGVGDAARQRGDAQPGLEAAPRSSSPGTTGAASTTTSRRRTVDANGYGLRVPALLISPYAQRGLHRPPDAQLRRVPQVHRGRLPRRRAARPEDRRPPRPAADRARGRCRCSATSHGSSTSRSRRSRRCSSTRP